MFIGAPVSGRPFFVCNRRNFLRGRWVTRFSLKMLEALRIAPQGTVRVSETLNLCAAAMAEAG